MFILDTDVLSTVMPAQPALSVTTWMLAQPTKLLFTASVCQAEILAGIAVMPHGRAASIRAAMTSSTAGCPASIAAANSDKGTVNLS